MTYFKRGLFNGFSLILWVIAACLVSPLANAQETVCARVKIEIKQKLTLERQGFDAEMKISNTLDSTSLNEVDITVHVTEENGVPVPITTNPDDLSAKFFIRVSNKQNINDISGNGVVNPSSTAIINWLLIPAPGAAGDSPLGKKYLIGATLKYKFGGETHTLEVSPDLVTVKPMPLLTLDYFLTQDVMGDDPMTPEIEPPEPFTLGVRVKNNGQAAAKAVKIESAQPKIIENNQGLAINFTLTGSYVDDAPVNNTLLINFGDIAATISKMGRWVMESTLAGEFVDFTASFTHADELGGALTSLLQATNAHKLIHDVRVDLPGRDLIRDFLARDGDMIRVYESSGADTLVADLSEEARLEALAGGAYKLSLPATDGFIYARIADPNRGSKSLGQVIRSDAKIMAQENIWLSRTKDRDANTWQYWINIFDANTTGQYTIGVTEGIVVPRAPVIQFITDKMTKEQQQVSFVVEASSPMGKTITLTAAQLPRGAQFVQQSQEGATVNAIFDWTPAIGEAGNYSITFTASDGSLSSTRNVNIVVESDAPPAAGPAIPNIVSPLVGAHVASLAPSLQVKAGQSSHDPTLNLSFELYKDASMNEQIAIGSVAKNTQTEQATAWLVPTSLNDNTWYWWRARALGASTETAEVSEWANGRFFVNLFNDPPEPFNLLSPAADAEADSLTPTLSLNNTTDKDDDPIRYGFEVYADAALTQLIAKVTDLPPGAENVTSWPMTQALSNHATYYWRASATDNHNASTLTALRKMKINTGNTAPTIPVLISPPKGGQSSSPTTLLTVQNSTDAESDPITYYFEINTEKSSTTGNRQASGAVAAGRGGETSWSVTNLIENQRYYWRVKASDAHAESAWATSNFLMNAVNEPPPLPNIKNPGDTAWVDSQHPVFEANPVLDPEDDPVSYRFEIYADAQMQTRVADGLSTSTQWSPSVALADKTRFYWRLRAEDDKGAASAWSLVYSFYIKAGAYADPVIALTAPIAPISGAAGQIDIHWESNTSLEPNIDLYYDTTGSGFGGIQIVRGLKTQDGSGTYQWDVSTLAPGTYYIYGVIYDSKGVGKAYAPGAVVRPPAKQAGEGRVIATPSTLMTDMMGKATYRVFLQHPPKQDVQIGLFSKDSILLQISPKALTFTPTNYRTPQIVDVAVLGLRNCTNPSSVRYAVAYSDLESLDPDYIGVKVKDTMVIHNEAPLTAGMFNNRDVAICNLRLINKTQVDAKTWDYEYDVLATSRTRSIATIQASITRVNIGGTVLLKNTVNFGAINANESARSQDKLVVRSNSPFFDRSPLIGIDWKVSITYQP